MKKKDLPGKGASHLLPNFNFSDVVVDDVECDGRCDADRRGTGVVHGAVHRCRHSRLSDHVTSGLGDAVLRHRRQGSVGRRPENVTLNFKTTFFAENVG